jgi:hypothetical protein
MTAGSMRILVVGDYLPGTGDVLRHLSNLGFGSRHVQTLRESRDVLGTFDFHVVLANEILRDGRGYDVADPVSRHSRTLIVGVALTESCLWLPVVYRGANVLGKRALSVEMLGDELESMLTLETGKALRDGVREFARPPLIIPPRPGLARPVSESARQPAAAREGLMRRKYRDREKDRAEL